MAYGECRFTGFLTQFWQSPTRPWFLIVPGSGKPIAVIPEIGAECMARTWVDDIRTWPSPHPSDDGVSLLKAALTEAVGATGRIGVPMGPETQIRMPLVDLEDVRRALAGVEFVDATDIVIALRRIKSEAEITKTAHICSVVSGAFEALPTIIHAGMTDIEAFRAFKIDILGRGADDVPTWSAAPRSAAPRSAAPRPAASATSSPRRRARSSRTAMS